MHIRALGGHVLDFKSKKYTLKHALLFLLKVLVTPVVPVVKTPVAKVPVVKKVVQHPPPPPPKKGASPWKTPCNTPKPYGQSVAHTAAAPPSASGQEDPPLWPPTRVKLSYCAFK
jgi:hypothetical protein